LKLQGNNKIKIEQETCLIRDTQATVMTVLCWSFTVSMQVPGLQFPPAAGRTRASLAYKDPMQGQTPSQPTSPARRCCPLLQ
jgi:hypothetical protein